MAETITAPILTLTLNPTIDLSSHADVVRPTHKIRTSDESFEPGGGGINVARVVAELGGAAELVYFAGGVTGAFLDELLGTIGLSGHRIPIAGQTRIAHTVHEHQTGLEYRFVPEGPAVSEAELDACVALVEAFRGRYIVASGSLPRGAPADIFARLAHIARRNGVRFVLDSSGACLKTTLETAEVHLVKPSVGELEKFVGRPLEEEEVREAALDLVRRGAAEMVAVTMGARGALLAHRGGVVRLPTPKVAVRSAVGAGDSFVGGMTWALAEGWPVEDAFRLGIAAGAAAVMTTGLRLCQRADVIRLYGAIERAPERGEAR